VLALHIRLRDPEVNVGLLYALVLFLKGQGEVYPREHL
jgi:hypothetical protein